MNVTFNINIAKFEKDIDFFQEQFKKAARDSVFQMSREVMGDIIKETVGPAPSPTVLHYKRTGHWAGGWEAAARFLGLQIPSTERTPYIVPGGIRHEITAENEETSFI